MRDLEQARRECQDRERWKLFCRGHPLVGAPRSRLKMNRIQGVPGVMVHILRNEKLGHSKLEIFYGEMLLTPSF